MVFRPLQTILKQGDKMKPSKINAISQFVIAFATATMTAFTIGWTIAKGPEPRRPDRTTPQSGELSQTLGEQLPPTTVVGYDASGLPRVKVIWDFS